ncbi:DUF3489 domain-containing protein [Novosphingobium sp.]|uniref:DUF3489 domain-containing protein n=1 Tax=Novosphingobium sp. TaxID=1874826 RepID=UPI003BA8BAB5
MTTDKLNDLQIILLSTSSRNDNGNLLPLPGAAAGDLARTNKAITALIRKGLVAEAPVTDRSLAWRDADRDPTGVFITEAGEAAIGLGAADAPTESSGAEPGPVEQSNTDGEEPTPQVAPAQQQRAGSKTDIVLDLLRRQTGATLAEMVAATGWLPHTTRAALTGLRKKGHAIVRNKRDNMTCYTIEVAA